MTSDRFPGIDVILTPAAVTADDLKGRTVIVADALRAGPVIVTALANGARAVIPAADTGEAGRLVRTLDSDVLLVGGERDGKPLPGSGAGASPSDYGPDAVRGRTVVLSTTNGTPTVALARLAASLRVASFLNASAAADAVRPALHGGLTILCAGDGGRVALEDALLAGRLVDSLAGPDSALTDGAWIARSLYLGSRDRLAQALFGARQTQRLIALGAGEDVAACARIDALDVVPVFRNNQLVR